MRKAGNSKQRDELRREYDFRALPVFARGPGRKQPPSRMVRLAPNAAVPNSESVNALRLLSRVAESRAVRRARAAS